MLIYIREKNLCSRVPVTLSYFERNRMFNAIRRCYLESTYMYLYEHSHKSNIYAFKKSCSTAVLLDPESHESRCFFRLISYTLTVRNDQQGKYCKNMTI